MPSESWNPELPDAPGPLYERIVDALERDMRTGVLAAGAKLPPQRNLAFRLGLSVGTVTRAYVEAERRGLVVGHVGRGTFVGESYEDAGDADPERVIDLAINVVPHQAAAARFASSVSAMKRRPDLLETLGYAPPAGQEAHRRSAANWLQGIANIQVDPNRMLLTSGAQQAMALAFHQLCKPGDVVMCEAATFYGMKSLADYAGFQLRGLDMDGEGLLPAALDRAARESGSKVLYVMPTAQNPTGRTMSRRRRSEIAKIVRRHALWVVEDDNYALFGPGGGLAPIAAEVPERCFYIGGVSKSVAPGLRLGFLNCPSLETTDAILKVVRATLYAPPSFGALVFSQWVSDGSAFEIGQAVREEIRRRAELARDILQPEFAKQIGSAPHFWLSMTELEAERVAGRALRLGVAITPPTGPIVDGSTISGLRICLGAVTSTAELTLGLRRLQSALAPGQDRLSDAIV